MHLIALLVSLTQPPVDAGLAARYGYPGDRYAGKHEYACQHTISKNTGKKAWIEMLSHGIAHRSLPCGTEVLICLKDNERCTEAYVVDRGPFGALDRAGHWHVRKRLRAGEHWRGIVDLLPGPAKALGISGIKPVLVWSSKPQLNPLVEYLSALLKQEQKAQSADTVNSV